ncbi:MAG: hypothetical protein WC641_04865 [Patescibacteria group bacterium]
MNLHKNRQLVAIMFLAFVAVLIGPANVSAGTGYRTSAEAQADLGACQARLNTAKQCIIDANNRIASLTNEKSRLENEMRDLESKKLELRAECDQALAELAAGMYCSQCGRSASEIVRQTGQSFEDHLTEVNGDPLPAPPEVIESKQRQCNQQIANLASRIENDLNRVIQVIADMQFQQMGAFRCRTQATLALEGMIRARRWFAVLSKLEAEKKLAASALPKPLTADKFGLGKNMRSSEYFVQRAYLKNGQVVTLGPGVIIDPNQFDHIKTHRGIDFASREDSKATSLPFTAGVNGKAWPVPGSAVKTINVKDDRTKNTIQLLHATTISAQFENCTETKPCGVSPWTRLGTTGKTGSNAIHLHVQVKDEHNNFIDPDMAFLPANSPFSGIESAVQNDLSREKSQIPQVP